MATDTRPLGLSYSVCHWDAEYPLGFVGCGVGLLWLWLVLLGQSGCDLGNLVAGCTILLKRGCCSRGGPMLLRGVLGLQKCSSRQQVSEPHSYEWQDPVFPSSVTL